MRIVPHTDPTIGDAQIALAEARLYVRSYAIYFFSTALQLVPVWVEGLGTLGVTKQLVLAIDPVWFTQHTSKKMLGGLLAHEILHVKQDLARLDALEDKNRANIAADIVVNDMLLSAMDRDNSGILHPIWELPEGAYTSQKLGLPPNKTIEEYYALLEDTSIPTLGACQGCCGSLAGTPFPGDLEEELNSLVGRSEADVRTVKQELNNALKEYAEGAGRGKLPAGLEVFIDYEDTPKVVPWRELLNASLYATFGILIAGSTDYSRRRPSKRSYMRGIILPGLVSYMPVLCIIEDTSGSMGERQLQVSRAETCSVLEQLGLTHVHHVNADVEPDYSGYLTLQELQELPVVGRGGTDFRPALEAALALVPKPQAIIYMTDGDGTAPASPPPDVEVIWCIVPSPHRRMPAKWGTVVIMSDDPNVRRGY